MGDMPEHILQLRGFGLPVVEKRMPMVAELREKVYKALMFKHDLLFVSRI